MKLSGMGIAVACAAIGVTALAWAQNVAIRAGEYEFDTEAHVSDEPAPVTSKDLMCISPEEAKDFQRVVLRQMREGDEDCTVSNVKSSSGHLSFVFSCPDGAPNEARIDIRYGSDWFETNSTWVDEGRTVTAKSRGKWLRASCTQSAPD